MSPKSVAPLVLSVILTACGGGSSDGDGATSTTATVPVDVSTITATTVAAPTTASTTTEAASMPPVPPSTEREPFAVDWQRPSGELAFETFDVVALRDDGSLVRFDDPRSGIDEEILTDDLPDPATVDSVAGVVDGALVIGSCCGDDAGLWAIERIGAEAERFADGISPTHSRARDWLVALSPETDELLVHDVPSALVTAPDLTVDGDPIGEVRDVLWGPDETSVYVLADDGVGPVLARVLAEPPFEVADLVSLPVAEGATGEPDFVGLGPSGEIGTVMSEGDEVVIRFVDPLTFEERPERERRLPAGASSVRIAPDGAGLLWVQDTALWFQPLFEEPRPLGLGIERAWFIR